VSAERLRVGILGAGVISEEYLRTLTASDEVEVVAIASRTPAAAEERARAFGIDARGVDELLSDDSIALIVNLTPPAAHLETSLEIVAAGKHVWSEKPLAMTPADARTLVAAADRRGVLVGVAPDTVRGPAPRRAIATITEGRIGTPRTASAVVQYWGPDAWHPNPEFLFQEGAGPVADMGPYWLALLIEVFGPVRSVVANARTSRPVRSVAKGPRAGEEFEPTVPTYVSALIDFAGGGSATCTFSFEASTKEMTLVVTGDDGAVRFADPNGFEGDVFIVVRDEETLVAGFEDEPTGRGIGVVAMARRLRTGAGDYPDASRGLQVVDLMAAIEESGRTGERVTVER
jgi:predicted dehydrogenase